MPRCPGPRDREGACDDSPTCASGSPCPGSCHGARPSSAIQISITSSGVQEPPSESGGGYAAPQRHSVPPAPLDARSVSARTGSTRSRSASRSTASAGTSCSSPPPREPALAHQRLATCSQKRAGALRRPDSRPTACPRLLAARRRLRPQERHGTHGPRPDPDHREEPPHPSLRPTSTTSTHSTGSPSEDMSRPSGPVSATQTPAPAPSTQPGSRFACSRPS